MTLTDELAQALRDTLLELNACDRQLIARGATEGPSVDAARKAANAALAKYDAARNARGVEKNES